VSAGAREHCGRHIHSRESFTPSLQLHTAQARTAAEIKDAQLDIRNQRLHSLGKDLRDAIAEIIDQAAIEIRCEIVKHGTCVCGGCAAGGHSGRRIEQMAESVRVDAG